MLLQLNIVFGRHLLVGDGPAALGDQQQKQDFYSNCNLSGNLLSGPLPQEIDNMQRLKLLILRNNTLSGKLPSELSKLSALEILDLSLNHFEGTVPDMSLSTLKIFNVSYNVLSGTIPPSLQRFPWSSFYPGNILLVSPAGMLSGEDCGAFGRSHHLKYSVRVAAIVGSVGAIVVTLVLLWSQLQAGDLAISFRTDSSGA